MTDYGDIKIPVIFESSDIMVDEEMKSNQRLVLGYVSCKYESDSDFEITVYYKRDNAMNWENIDPFTVSKDERRFFQRLPIGLSCIDAYAKLSGDFGELIITSFKLHAKPAVVGKFGG
jgi:hypothetical protein